MRPHELIEILAERPFAPLRLHMSNGRTHDIRHPELAIVGQDAVAIGVESDEGELPTIRLISVSHINEIERIPSSTSA